MVWYFTLLDEHLQPPNGLTAVWGSSAPGPEPELPRAGLGISAWRLGSRSRFYSQAMPPSAPRPPDPDAGQAGGVDALFSRQGFGGKNIMPKESD